MGSIGRATLMKKIILAVVLSLSVVPSANAAQTTFPNVQKAIESLKVADESRAGYVRSKFKHWVGTGDGCDSRKSVIISEAIVKPKVEKGCVIKGGEWLSIYDNARVIEAGKLDVDHMVPLAEAWDSGASTWTDKQRELYANDQTDPRHLIAVTGSSNRSKSDQDPAEWLPTNKSYVCEYIANWVSIKARWSLSIDKKEKDALLLNLKGCKTTKIVISTHP
jgi:hypothetical protein